MSGEDRGSAYRYAGRPSAYPADGYRRYEPGLKSSIPSRSYDRTHPEEPYERRLPERVHPAYNTSPSYADPSHHPPPPPEYRRPPQPTYRYEEDYHRRPTAQQRPEYADDYHRQPLHSDPYRDIDDRRAYGEVRSDPYASHSHHAYADPYRSDPVHDFDKRRHAPASAPIAYDRYGVREGSRPIADVRQVVQEPAYRREEYDAYAREIQPSYRRGAPRSPVLPPRPVVHAHERKEGLPPRDYEEAPAHYAEPRQEPESPPRPSMSIFNMLNDRSANGGSAASVHSSPAKSVAAAETDAYTSALPATSRSSRAAFDPAREYANSTARSAAACSRSPEGRSRRLGFIPDPEDEPSLARQSSVNRMTIDGPSVRVKHEERAASLHSSAPVETSPVEPLQDNEPSDAFFAKASALESSTLSGNKADSAHPSSKPAPAKTLLKLRNTPLPASKSNAIFVAPPPPAKKHRDPDGWESDLSNSENQAVWQLELDDYVFDMRERMRLIEDAFEATLHEKHVEVEKRLARAYEGRHFAIIRQLRIREQQEASQRDAERRKDHVRQQRDHEIDLELLDTLDDGQPGKKRRGGRDGDDEVDELLQGDEDDDSDDVALADIAARANSSKANIIKLKRSKGKLGSVDPRSKKRRLDGGAASSSAPGSDADSTLADLADMDGDDSVFASRQGSPTLDDASFALDLDAAGKVPIDARRAQQLEDAHRRIWSTIAKRDIPKVYRTVLASSSSKTMYWRRLSSVVQREAKRGAARNNKTVKDVQLRARKVMREVLVFWKRNEKEERELRKKAEREAVEKAKKEEEMREAKRQARKLNFLISQTELYSHFIGSKLKTAEAEESEETAGSSKIIDPNAQPSDATVPPINPHAEVADAEARLAELDEIDFDDDDESNLRAHAARNAQEAVRLAKEKAQAFDIAAAEERRRNEAAAREREGLDAGPGKQIEEKDLGKAFDSDDMNFLNPTSMGQSDVKQPKMLTAQLKEYQLKGLNWLANLYEQGINGILADEMGLGKTVQSISLMAYLAEVHDIWGPFLVIAPASTLHNWQQEISKFVPTLKALPYWGNVKDRAVLRKFWNRKQISYNRDAPFHVLVTSYQLVVSDEKYFQRVKWQYMILDEAQAIKSSSSIRWKTLLGFNCRNRLLLTGTPVQNSMQELWALLHFIMPSLFDSHDEFSEWFSKDIESHAEQKGTLNEHQLRRLHMILKPFMLRRIKKNVQNELGDKIEIDVFCDLSARQKMLYRGLRANISVAELMDRATSNDEAGLKSLMNLVMQFRKVCNHPELFERADVRAPFALADFAHSGSLAREGDLLNLPDSTTSLIELQVPKLLVREGGLFDVPGHNSRKGFDTGYLQNLFNIWRAPHIHESLQQQRSPFASLPLIGVSSFDAERAFRSTGIKRILAAAADERRWRSIEAFASDDEFAAASIRPIAKMLRPMPTNSGRAPSLLMPLEEVSADYRRHSYLAKDSARAVVAPAVAPPIRLYSNDGPFMQAQERFSHDPQVSATLFGLSPEGRESVKRVEELQRELPDVPPQGVMRNSSIDQLPYNGMQVPQMNKLIVDSSKMAKLDELLRELKANGHRVLIYFQMTRMIDLMEEYLIYRQYKYLRLDGASKISDRRDMVTDWQTKPELFIFLLSTRAGGLGINLTAADTVIFYDHDWNPSNDSQAMDRAHRLGQTKQVTVYRLITKGTIDERIVRLARNKKEVQDIVVGTKAYSETGMAKPQEIVSLLLDDDELAESMLRKKQAEEAQNAQDKADSARAMVAKRRLNKDRAAAAARSPGPAANTQWSLEDDEDDFFGARPPSKGDTDTAETTPQPQLKKRGGASSSKRGRVSEAASERMTPLDLDGDVSMEQSPLKAAPGKRKSKSHRKKTVDELAGLDLD
ncbi:related to INO80-ATPase with chromatin remodeling and helicase activity [Ustilago bromivora]|uniref:Chromatin-remodeling ATPase INO80 n=1 Tax=Ustilago bromivora TaxID=307758 RepID=A0A1K0FUS1_9BASI|nr:related to INO80-ATPase with chromatin remodeling and helicase activity [Ustilago bromivora]SYW84433.1 related to INO80 - ATPase with chromatin remodeling and helicase activity [Ustilago bromivora]